MPAVHFVGARERYTSSNMIERFKGALEKGELHDLFSQGDLVAVKFDAGEKTALGYVRPPIVKAIVDAIYSCGGYPVLLDTLNMNTKASDVGRNWLEATALHGFSVTSLGKSPMLADGYTGEEELLVPVEGGELGGVEVARAIAESHALVVVSHVAAHPFAGLSGALVSCGVGCVSLKGKGRVHAPLRPIFMRDRCDGCGECERHCPHGAVSLENNEPQLDEKSCIGCAYYCTAACPVGAIVIDRSSTMRFQKRVVDSAMAVNTALKGKVYYVNVLIDICPYPDCYPFSDVPFVSDQGILMSSDPVALDSATLSVIDKAPGLPGSIADECDALSPGRGKLFHITGVDPKEMILYAAKQGLGQGDFRVFKV